MARPIVILTGAGISAESGIPTFRGPGGLWEGHRIEDVATPEAFRRDAKLVHRFYSARRARLLEAGVAPNDAHRSLARLAAGWPAPVRIVTQNVDDLHERSGFVEAGGELLHMHGELLKLRNQRTGAVQPWRGPCDVDCCDPETGERGVLRPHIVWFGEEILGADTISEWLGDCGDFLAIGTQGAVWPAAGFVREAKERSGARCLEFNLTRTEVSAWYDETLIGPAGITVPAWVDRVLGGTS